ncbi:MAG: hypothetical protein ACE5FI_03195 [Anaerolineales bacterium]
MGPGEATLRVDQKITSAPGGSAQGNGGFVGPGERMARHGDRRSEDDGKGEMQAL